MLNKMMQSFLNILKQFYQAIKPSLIAIAIGLLIGFIILIIFSPLDAFPAMITLLKGGFNDGIRGVGNTLYRAAPIVFTGMAVAFAFKTGLFNIGASGQMMVGALVAIFVGVKWVLPGSLHWLVALFFGMLAGGFWGLVPGLLKATRNVNEVVSSIMMNYIAGHLIIYFIRTQLYNPNYARSLNIRTSAQLPSLRWLFPGSLANIGIVIAIIVVIIVHIVIHKTTLGFQLKASGFSIDGSKYAGMNTKLNIIVAMFVSGMLAGLGGAISYLVVGKTIGTSFEIFSEGFDGISVALLGLGEPVGALFSGILLSHLRMGGFYMQRFGFVPEIIDIIISVVIYVTAISVALQALLKRYRGKIVKKIKVRKLKAGEE